MADGEGVGAIGAEGFWRLVPSGDRSDGRRLVLCFLLPRLPPEGPNLQGPTAPMATTPSTPAMGASTLEA